VTEKHSSPEWRRTVRLVRAQAAAAWARGDEVRCWRHGDLLDPEQPWDVGHLTTTGGEDASNAAPECRRGNRSHGGKIGAQITNGRKAAASGKTTFATAPWV
jgi:hypothetical protein